VPHELLRVAELGGIYVTRVVGAVPEIVVDGLEVAVPPVMLAVAPTTAVPSSDQTVTNVSTVELVAVAVVLMKLVE
jgi:hypothetical protein